MSVVEHIRGNQKLIALARRSVRTNYTKKAAAREMLDVLKNGLSMQKTPDGENFTLAAIEKVMSAFSGELASDFAIPDAVETQE